MKKPITVAEYFNLICGILWDKGKFPDILDYALSSNDTTPIKTCEFDAL